MSTERVISAAEMAWMSPNERAAAVAAGTITDITRLPEPFRSAVLQRAAEWNGRIASERV